MYNNLTTKCLANITEIKTYLLTIVYEHQKITIDLQQLPHCNVHCGLLTAVFLLSGRKESELQSVNTGGVITA